MKLTKKQTEIVEILKQLEKENNCKIYLLYNKFTKKIHPIRIDGIEKDELKYKMFSYVCTHRFWETMEEKGIVVPDLIYKSNNYSINDLYLCRLADELGGFKVDNSHEQVGV